MVYKTKFLKQVIEQDFVPTKDGPITWELSDEALSAVWLTVKGDLKGADQCIDDFMMSITGLDVWMGGFNIDHYSTGIKALLMNCKLKQHWPYLVQSTQTPGWLVGVSFPLMFGAPYLNDAMALPRSLSNRKKLTLNFDIATKAIDPLTVDISEVILPGANPVGFIKQEESSIEAKGTGDKDLWLQTNWDLLKLMIGSPTVASGSTGLSTINRAGLEIDDFAFGYKAVPWQHLHAEIMDELEGSGPVEDHYHASGGTSVGLPVDLEHWIRNFGELDFFFNKDIKWRAPLAGASTAKLKYNAGISECWNMVTACYVPTAKVS